jgi:hypothetical protein
MLSLSFIEFQLIGSWGSKLLIFLFFVSTSHKCSITPHTLIANIRLSSWQEVSTLFLWFWRLLTVLAGIDCGTCRQSFQFHCIHSLNEKACNPSCSERLDPDHANFFPTRFLVCGYSCQWNICKLLHKLPGRGLGSFTNNYSQNWSQQGQNRWHFFLQIRFNSGLFLNFLHKFEVKAMQWIEFHHEDSCDNKSLHLLPISF